MTEPVPLRRCLDSLAARRVPGGCPDCSAYQTLERNGRVYVLTVHHDNGCPHLNGVTR